MQDGTIVDRTAGTPQGGVISPVLANLFLHYVFDDFMSKEFPNIQWVRYADDGALNCVSLKQAEYIIKVLDTRFKKFGLELNLTKTRIVYCKDGDRKGNYENKSFDFLGFTFRRRQVRDKEGRNFTGFLPAISDKAQKDIRRTVRDMRLQGKVSISLKDIARILNPKIQGWINYYGHYYKSGMYKTLRYINRCIVKWVKRKYKMRTIGKAMKWLYNVSKKNSEMFVHWKIGIISMA